MTKEELMDLRAKIAAEYGFALYRRYTTQQVMGLLGMSDDSKLKRNRQTMPHVREAGGSIYYLGIHIADWLAFGEEAVRLHPKVSEWQNTVVEPLPLGTSIWQSAAPLGTAADTIPTQDRPNAIRSALTAKK